MKACLNPEFNVIYYGCQTEVYEDSLPYYTGIEEEKKGIYTFPQGIAMKWIANSTALYFNSICWFWTQRR